MNIQVFGQTHLRAKQQLCKESENEFSALVVGNPACRKYPALPAASREAMQIAKLYGVDPVLETQGTLSYVTSRMPAASIIHLATHGILELRRNENAYIPGAIVLGDDDGMYKVLFYVYFPSHY